MCKTIYIYSFCLINADEFFSLIKQIFINYDESEDILEDINSILDQRNNRNCINPIRDNNLTDLY
jgi:hypothetical protein